MWHCTVLVCAKKLHIQCNLYMYMYMNMCMYTCTCMYMYTYMYVCNSVALIDSCSTSVVLLQNVNFYRVVDGHAELPRLRVDRQNTLLTRAAVHLQHLQTQHLCCTRTCIFILNIGTRTLNGGGRDTNEMGCERRC